MNIRKLKESKFAREYLVSWLAAGLSTLATQVRQKHGFLEGNFSIIAPDSVDIDHLTRLGTEARDADHSAAVRLFAKVVSGFITNRNCTVLLQDFVNHVSDLHWEEYEFKDCATTYNREVYWEVKGRDISDSKIEKLVSDWSSYFPVSAFFCISPSPDRKKCLSYIDLEYLADNLIGVAVDVFDGDSFLIWWRGNLRPFPRVA